MSTQKVATKNSKNISQHAPVQSGKNAERRRRKKKAPSTRAVFNNEGLVIPRNEQDRMVKTVSTPSERMVRQYIGMMLHPKSNMCRAPDSYVRPTGLVRSVMTYNVPIEIWSTDPDTGKFAIAIQPWLGNVSDPAKYKIAMAVSTEQPWNLKDFSSAIPYSAVVEGLDIRTDINYSSLTQPPRASYVLQNTTSATSPAPFIYPEDANTSWMHYNAPGIFLMANNVQNQWRLAPGQYMVNFTATTADTFTASLNIVFVSGDAADFNKDYVQLLRSPDSKLASISMLITVRRKTVVIGLDCSTTTPNAALTNVRISITPTYYMGAFGLGTSPVTVNSTSIPNDDMGQTQGYRAVAMSALATYTGPMLTNGGNIAGAYVPGGTLKDAFFTNAPNPAYGRGQDWDRVATWNNSYNGQLKDGIYAFWTPEDTDEFVFRPPSEMTDQEPPALVICGQYAPGTAPPDGTVCPVLRLEVVTVYEISTVSQLFEISQLVGSQAMLDMANAAMASQPHVMQNATHMSWLKDFWGGLKKGLSYWETPARAIWDNRNSIAPLLGL